MKAISAKQARTLANKTGSSLMQDVMKYIREAIKAGNFSVVYRCSEKLMNELMPQLVELGYTVEQIEGNEMYKIEW